MQHNVVGGNVSLCLRQSDAINGYDGLNIEIPVVSLNMCVWVFGSLSADRCSYSTRKSDPDQPQHPDPFVIRDTHTIITRKLSL